MDIQFFLTESAFSHDQIRDLLTRAINPGGEADIRCWPREVYDDYLIYADGEHLYRRAYAIDADGTVTLGDAPVEVVQQTQYVAVTESVAEPQGIRSTLSRAVDALRGRSHPTPPTQDALFGGLLEAVDAEGWNWRIQVIQAGVSQNGNEYPLSVLHEAAPIYSGVPVFAGRGPDHNRAERGFESVAGYITEARPNPRGVEATFEINRGRPEVRDSIRHAWDVRQRTGRDTVGFSHVCPPGGFITEARRPRGRRITKILRAESVDLVMEAAAGGALLAPLMESTSGSPDSGYVFDALKEAIVNVEQLLAKLREGKKLSLEELAFLQESLSPADFATALTEGRTAQPIATPAPAGAAAPNVTATLPDPRLTESVSALEARIAESERRAHLAEARASLTQRLAEARLPEAFRAAIAADFDGRLFESAELDARIERDRGIAAQMLSVRPTGLGVIEITADQRDKHQAAMDGMFGLVRGASEREDRTMLWLHTPTHFRSLREAFEQVTGRRMHDGRELLAEAVSYVPDGFLPPHLQESVTSSTFAEILGDSIRRRMVAQYLMPDLQSFMQLVSEISSLADFRTNRRMRLGGYGDLPTVLEGGTYQPLTSPGDEEATYAPSKKGGLEDLTMETVMNDDMQVVRQIPIRLGDAAVRTLRHYIFNTILRDNITLYDSVALFHASHGNTDTTALSAAQMSAIRRAMRDQAPYGVTSQPLGAGNLPRRLFVPAELEELAFKLATSVPYVLATNENATTPNLHRGLEVTVVDEWTDATDYVVAADPANTPIIELGFLNGREEPELFIQDAQTVGSVFTADKITWKIRHIWGAVVLDYRGLYKSVVA